MGRWSAPSDYDYYEQFTRFDSAGIERTCTGCGEPVMVQRDEAYTLQVFCEHCQRKMREAPATTKGAA